MRLDKLTPKKLAKKVERIFGSKAVHDIGGKYCFIHLDEPTDQIRRSRRDSFVPTLFFDRNCPGCRPFLEEGAFMVFDGSGLFAMRELGGGRFETVALLGKKAAA